MLLNLEEKPEEDLSALKNPPTRDLTPTPDLSPRRNIHPHVMSSSSTSSAAAGLLQRQLREMQRETDIPGISCGLVNDNNIFEWEVRPPSAALEMSMPLTLYKVMLMINDECKYYGGSSPHPLPFPPG